MTYHDAVAYLETLTNYERVRDPEAMGRIQLARMEALCRRLGNPQKQFRSIIVAGTNGKGSICAMLDSMLRRTGLRVGLYTSPHIEDLRERIRVGGEWIEPEAFAALIARMQPEIQAVSDPALGGPPTYFEVLTAAAFMHFARQRVQIAVLEVGLGGRLDATNVVEPAVAVLAPIGLDHTDVLGPDVASIAREKAGIIKPGSIVVAGPQRPEAQQVIAQAAAAHGCRLLSYGDEFAAESVRIDEAGVVCTLQGSTCRLEDAFIPLLGRYQAENAAVALAAIEQLSGVGAPYEAVRAGLRQVQWPGRAEILHVQPLVVLDGAHNPPAAHALRAAVEEQWRGRPVHVLIGMSSDKAYREVAGILGPMAARIICTKTRHVRACDPEALAQAFAGSSAEVLVIPDALDAYTYLVNTAPEDSIILVTGSLFLVGELRDACATLGMSLAEAKSEL